MEKCDKSTKEFGRRPEGKCEHKLYLSDKPYAIVKTQEEGERDLVSLARTERFEGSWIYTPLDSTWYHPKQERGEDTENETLSVRIVKQEFETWGPTVNYHTHPSFDNRWTKPHYLLPHLKKYCPGLSKDWIKNALTLIECIDSTLPSANDFLYGANRMFDKYCIASPYGVIVYSFSPDKPIDAQIAIYEHLIPFLYSGLINRLVKSKKFLDPTHDPYQFIGDVHTAIQKDPFLSLQLQFTPYKI